MSKREEIHVIKNENKTEIISEESSDNENIWNCYILYLSSDGVI